MIATLKGILTEKNADTIIVDVHGVGYELIVPLSTFYALPEPGVEVFLKVYTAVKEDSIKLYGFYTVDEKRLFLLLTTVTGIGPKLGCSILSGITVGDFAAAVLDGDVATLTRVPGLGKKTAERLLLELKEKVGELALSGAVRSSSDNLGDALCDDVLSALSNLGYKRNVATDAVRKVAKDNPDAGFETILKESLKILSGKA